MIKIKSFKHKMDIGGFNTEIEKSVKRACKEISDEMVNDSLKKHMLRQHLFYKLTGSCHPILDKLVNYAINKVRREKKGV